jgi:hypothetical protein
MIGIRKKETRCEQIFKVKNKVTLTLTFRQFR